jgi:hypothetical protein
MTAEVCVIARRRGHLTQATQAVLVGRVPPDANLKRQVEPALQKQTPPNLPLARGGLTVFPTGKGDRGG